MAEEREEESTSPAVAEDQILVEETPAIIPQEQNLQEENLQEQNMEIEESQVKARIGKKRQKRRRAITYLLHISKQVEKNGNQIDRISTFIQSLQKQRRFTIASRTRTKTVSITINQTNQIPTWSSTKTGIIGSKGYPKIKNSFCKKNKIQKIEFQYLCYYHRQT